MQRDDQWHSGADPYRFSTLCALDHIVLLMNNKLLSLLLLLLLCLNPESLLHVVAGCQQYLDRFTWRHDSILNFIAKSLQPVINVHSSLYADVNGFLNPSIITGENYCPDLLFLIQSKCPYVLELTVGFESNLT